MAPLGANVQANRRAAPAPTEGDDAYQPVRLSAGLGGISMHPLRSSRRVFWQLHQLVSIQLPGPRAVAAIAIS